MFAWLKDRKLRLEQRFETALRDAVHAAKTKSPEAELKAIQAELALQELQACWGRRGRAA